MFLFCLFVISLNGQCHQIFFLQIIHDKIFFSFLCASFLLNTFGKMANLPRYLFIFRIHMVYLTRCCSCHPVFDCLYKYENKVFFIHKDENVVYQITLPIFNLTVFVVDLDPYVFGPPGSGSFHNQAKK